VFGEYQQLKSVFTKTDVEYLLKSTKVVCFLLRIFIGLSLFQSLIFYQCMVYYSDIYVIYTTEILILGRHNFKFSDLHIATESTVYRF